MLIEDSKSILLEFETPQFLHSLFGNDLKELKYLETELGVKAVTREGWLHLEGGPEELSLIKQAFLDLEEARRNGVELHGRDFRTAIDVARGSGQAGVAKITQVKLLGTQGRKAVVPRNPRQLEYVQAMLENEVVFGLGPAGTGKTYLAMAMALTLLKQKKINRLVLTRPAVEAGEALGFLPGDLLDKIAPYLRPLYDALHEMLDGEEARRYLENGTIEIAPLAYMRGRTLSNSFVILDEAQNTTCEQMFMFLTRLGEGTHCVVTGDGSQIDLKKNIPSGLLEAEKALQKVQGVKMLRFSSKHVVRHPIVGRIIDAYDDHRSECIE